MFWLVQVRYTTAKCERIHLVERVIPTRRREMKRTVYVVLLFVLSAMILAACGGTPAAEAPAEPATEPAAVQEEASEDVVAEPE